MIIGINSWVGFAVIPGEQMLQGAGSILDNALKTFQMTGGLPGAAKPEDAVQFAKSFASQLRGLDKLPDQIVRGFPHIHSQLCAQSAVVPIGLHAAFDSFQTQPTVAGVIKYFNTLAQVLADESLKRPSKPPRK